MHTGPMQTVETVQWLLHQEDSQLFVCRVKNKFKMSSGDVTDGYRDVSLNVIHTAHNGLSLSLSLSLCVCVCV